MDSTYTQETITGLKGSKKTLKVDVFACIFTSVGGEREMTYIELRAART